MPGRKLYVYGIFIATIISILAACSQVTSPDLAFSALLTENLVNPVGIENPAPAFSWVVETGGHGREQSAYHLLVATSADLLSPEKADAWNPGKMASPESVHVQYEGKVLQLGKEYWWRVRIWDEAGRPSEWSAPHSFETGIPGEKDWQSATWLSLKEDTRTSEYRFREVHTRRMEQPAKRTSYPVGYFRREFRVGGRLKEARAYVCGLGYYELYLNGARLGDHVLDPAPTSYDHHALYVTYDITRALQKGANTAGIILGSGFYGQNMAFNTPFLLYGKPAFRILIRLDYRDGSTEYVVSDGNWSTGTGPIVFDNVYGGETYDARYELGEWTSSGFDDTGWQKAEVISPHVREIRSQLMPPIRKLLELAPVRIFRAANGNWIADFGQNISGWVRIGFQGEEEMVVGISTAEALTRSGDAIHSGSLGKTATGFNQDDYYICGGDGPVQWEPRFTYHGFQFAEITGLKEKPDRNSLKAIVICNDVRQTGDFTCSDPLLNRMVEVSKWTVIDNLHGFPEDCPHREKCGWLGDAHATAVFNLYSYDMYHLYRKYQKDIQSQLALRASGSRDDTTRFMVPDMIAPDKRKTGVAKLDWGIAGIYIPWYHYLHYGDPGLITEHYGEMKEMVAYYLTFRNDRGIIENGLGDWCPLRWDRRDNPGAMECHPFVSANAYFCDILGIMGRISDLMEDPEYRKYMQEEKQKLTASFNRQFLEPIGGSGEKWYGSQTGTVMALQFGLVPDSIREDVVRGLTYDITHNHNGHHSTGIHGNRYLYTLLNELGEEELSHSVLTHPGFPSQAYILNSGLTTWPERQWEWDSGIEWDRSMNHPMQAGFAAFFFESVAGIRPLPEAPGFKEFVIKPSFFDILEQAHAEIQTPYGKVLSDWVSSDKGVTLAVEVPFNTRARIILPKNLSGHPAVTDSGGQEITISWKGQEAGFVLGSGRYTVEFQSGD